MIISLLRLDHMFVSKRSDKPEVTPGASGPQSWDIAEFVHHLPATGSELGLVVNTLEC